MELLSDFSSIRRLVSSRNDLFGGAFVILAARSFEVNERVNMFTRQRPRPSNERRKEGIVGKERVCRLVAAACRDAHGAPEGFRIRRSQTSCKRVCPEVLRWNRRFRRFGSAGSDLTGRRTPSNEAAERPALYTQNCSGPRQAGAGLRQGYAWEAVPAEGIGCAAAACTSPHDAQAARAVRR